MLGEISLATEPLFSKDPEEIVREFQSQAQKGAPLALVLYPEEWPPHDRPPERLIFSKDSITLAGKGDDKAIPLEEAVSEVARTQLIMRRTIHVSSFWEHGYDWPDEGIPLQVEFITDVKMSLRRDVVRAATFRHLVSDHGLEEATLLLALAEYGFARLEDVPPACRPTIWRTANLHIGILRNGMHVLEIGGAPPAAGSLVLGQRPKATTGKRGRPRKP